MILIYATSLVLLTGKIFIFFTVACSNHETCKIYILQKFPCTQQYFFSICNNTTSTSMGWRVVDSYEVVGKGYVNIENNQIAYIDAIFSSTYHIKQLNKQPTSSSSFVVIYSQLSVSPAYMEPFKDHTSTHGYLTSLKNKPQQKQPAQFSASILV